MSIIIISTDQYRDAKIYNYNLYYRWTMVLLKYTTDNTLVHTVQIIGSE